MRFLTCEPNLDTNLTSYMDEADKFDVNPEAWFSQNKNQIKDFTYLVMFENLYRKLIRLQEATGTSESKIFLDGFRIQNRFFHSFIEQSERTGKHMLLLSTIENEAVDQEKIKSTIGQHSHDDL